MTTPSPQSDPFDDSRNGPQSDPLDDPLMVAITGQEAPAHLRTDPAYGAAVTDVALLSDEIHRLGDALGHLPGPGAETVPAPRRGRSRRRTALLALAASCAAALLGGTVWLSAQGGLGGGATEKATTAEDRGGDGDSMTPEGTVACARLIVEGTVARVDSLPGATQDRITLDVSRSYKPDGGERQVSFPMDVDVHPRLRPGDRTLVLVPRDSAEPSHWAVGKDIAAQRAWIVRALPGARELTCETRADVRDDT